MNHGDSTLVQVRNDAGALGYSCSPFLVHRSSFCVSRGGFTLVETLLVLALLTAIGALVWPALEKPFAAERLRKAADQLAADLTRGRVAAINAGRAHRLQFEATTGRYGVVPVDDGADSDPFSLPATTDAAAPQQALTEQLPEGVAVAQIVTQDDVTPPPTMTTPPAAAAALANDAANEAAATDSGVIYFHPDGTTSTAEILLVGEHQSAVRLRLRGLTGAAAVGELETVGAAP